MMKDVQHLEQLERYLRHKATDTERFEIETELGSNNTELSSELADFGLLFKGFNGLHHENFVAQLNTFEQNIKAEQQIPTPLQVASVNRTKLINRWIGRAAAVLLIPVAAWTFYYVQTDTPQQGLSGASLYASNFKAADNYLPDTRAVLTPDAPDAEINLAEGSNAYNKKDYATAARYFKIYLKSFPNRSDVKFYLGVSLLEQDLDLEANEIFKALATEPQNAYAEQATWYLALTYLKSNDKEKAKPLLEDLAKTASSTIKAQAQSLLNSL